MACDSTDGYKGQSRCGAGLSNAFHPNHRIGVLFGRCGVDRPNRNVIDGKRRSLPYLGEIVGGKANHSLSTVPGVSLAENRPRSCRREIILAQVDTIGISRQADIKAVIDDQCGAASSNAPEFASATEHARCIGRLIAVLNESGPGGNEVSRKANKGAHRVGCRRKTAKIDDGIDPRKAHRRITHEEILQE
jgi:hypothetical protein